MQSEISVTNKAIQFFIWRGDVANDKLNFMYKCKLCDETKPPVSGKYKNNLLKHVQRSHVEFYFEKILTLKPKDYNLERLKLLFQFVEVVTINARPFANLEDSGWEGVYREQ